MRSLEGPRSDEVKVDLAPDGTTYGIELMNTNAQLANANGPELVVVNQAFGESRTFPPDGRAKDAG